MDNRQMRDLRERLGTVNYKINYKTGVHLGVIEDFFSGRIDELAPGDRRKIEALLEQEVKQHLARERQRKNA